MKKLKWLAVIVIGYGLSYASVHGLTVAELQALLQQNEPVQVIDIRSTSLFQKGHIPGAINVPAKLVGQKRLPPLGHVVVCDEGLARGDHVESVEALNQKPGISAEWLEGGYAAWVASSGTTTAASGVGPEDIPVITYQQLRDNQNQEVFLVDLRSEVPRTRQGSQEGDTPREPLTDLKSEFPKIGGVTSSLLELPRTRQSGPPPLVVLIDDGDGAVAREAARLLKGNGRGRIVVLAGGEEIIKRQGAPGLQRTGLGSGVELESNPFPGGGNE